ncbi:MAG: YcxB family protein [Acutalibacteraceae bacterium]
MIDRDNEEINPYGSDDFKGEIEPFENFSVSFNLTGKDYKNYFRDFKKATVISIIKRSFLVIGLALVFFFVNSLLFSDGETGMPFYLLGFCLVAIFFPVIYNRMLFSFMSHGRANEKESSYDFYLNHVVITVPPTEKCKNNSEKHYKTSDFRAVLESKNNFYFQTVKGRMMIIPKRVLDAVNYERITKYIDMCFNMKFMKI